MPNAITDRVQGILKDVGLEGVLEPEIDDCLSGDGSQGFVAYKSPESAGMTLQYISGYVVDVAQVGADTTKLHPYTDYMQPYHELTIQGRGQEHDFYLKFDDSGRITHVSPDPDYKQRFKGMDTTIGSNFEPIAREICLLYAARKYATERAVGK